MNAQAHDALAALLQYPSGELTARVPELAAQVVAACPEAAADLEPFVTHVAQASLVTLEERFAETFDINPSCSLEVGWQVYGEDYARGSFLVGMRQALRHLELPESAELPDHLTHVLRILGRLPQDQAGEIARIAVLPALDKMIAALEAAASPHLSVLRAARRLVAAHAEQPEEVSG